MFKELFKYKGRRMRKYHVHDWLLHFCVLLLPFLIGIGYISYRLFYPIVTNLETPKQLIAPSVIIITLILVACFLVNTVMRASQLKGGYFLKVKYYDAVAKMLKLGGYTIKKENKQAGKKAKEVFPKVYVRNRKDTVEVRFPLDGGQNHDRFLKQSKTLEEMFLADCVGETPELGAMIYAFMTNVISKRITINEVVVKDGVIKLMDGVEWAYDNLPHMLIAGGTGGGKTYFMYALIRAFLEVGTVYICDPKSADLADLSDIPVFEGKVFYGKGEMMIRCLEDAVKRMEQRFAAMKAMPNYRSGKNYAYYGMPPEFIIFDEWKAFYGSLGRDFKNIDRVNNAVQQITMKARQAGVFLILGTQKPDSSDFPSGVRDNLMCRVTLGKLSIQGYYMVFGEDSKNKAFFNKPVKGRGYIDNGENVVREFYSPLVPANYNFLEEFAKVEKMIEFDFEQAERTEES